MANDAAITLPLLTSSGSDWSASWNMGGAMLPLFTIEATSTRLYGIGENDLPALTVASRGGGFGANILPVLALSASGSIQVRGSASLRLPLFVSSGQAGLDVHTVSTNRTTLPLFTATGTGVHNAVGTGANVISIFTVTGESLIGQVYALAVNLDNTATTDITQFAFNSFCRFKGAVLGAGATGIREITGETDAGTDIPFRARLGGADFDTTQGKRVADVFIHGSSLTPFDVMIIEDQTETPYSFPTQGGDGRPMRYRAKPGRGILEGSMIEIEIANTEGSAVFIDEVEVIAEVLQRRIVNR